MHFLDSPAKIPATISESLGSASGLTCHGTQRITVCQLLSSTRKKINLNHQTLPSPQSKGVTQVRAIWINTFLPYQFKCFVTEVTLSTLQFPDVVLLEISSVKRCEQGTLLQKVWNKQAPKLCFSNKRSLNRREQSWELLCYAEVVMATTSAGQANRKSANLFLPILPSLLSLNKKKSLPSVPTTVLTKLSSWLND